MSKVHSVVEYLQVLNNITIANEEELFYRGLSKNCYSDKMSPTCLRNKDLEEEYNCYHEIMLEYPEEFKKGEHLSNLVKMQHFGGKTRLVDLSANPLISLFFAAEQHPDIDGEVLCFRIKKSEILHHTSDKALMLACLPLFTNAEKKEMENFCRSHMGEITDEDIKYNKTMRRFLHEIRSEFPAFETCIIGEDLLKTYCVKANKDNIRMKKQSGLFFICGLGEQERKSWNKKSFAITIDKDSKKRILEELRRLDISNSTIYPDFERRAMEISHLQVNWTIIGNIK